MMKMIKHGDLTWINIQSPSTNDILYLKENFQLHPLVLEEFTSPSQRPRAEEFENCLYVVIHIPLFNLKEQLTISGELDIVITKDHLITAHIGQNIPLKKIIKEFNEDKTLREKAMSRDSGFLLYFILEKLLSSCFPKIDRINEKLNDIEKQIFEDNEKTMVKETSAVKRDIFSFRRTLKPQRGVLESLAQKHSKFLDDSLNRHFHELIGTNIRVWHALENTKEVIESLEETNNALVSYKISETMRLFTAVSFITFTLSVFVGIFGMAPFEGFPLSNSPVLFWVLLAIMGLIILTMLTIFKKKKWI